MPYDIYEELRAHKHAIAGLLAIVHSIVRELPEGSMKNNISKNLEYYETKFYKRRDERFDFEVKEAEKVLDKAGQIGDYGAAWTGDKFVFRGVYDYLESEYKILDEKLKKFEALSNQDLDKASIK